MNKEDIDRLAKDVASFKNPPIWTILYEIEKARLETLRYFNPVFKIRNETISTI